MCAEAVPFRCHRSLIADALLVRGAEVAEIASAKRAAPHRITPFALVEGTRITYPGEEGGQLTAAASFHLEATVRVLQRRPSNLVDRWEDDKYRRLLATARGLALIQVENRGSIDEPELSFECYRVRSRSATARRSGEHCGACSAWTSMAKSCNASREPRRGCVP